MDAYSKDMYNCKYTYANDGELRNHICFTNIWICLKHGGILIAALLRNSSISDDHKPPKKGTIYPWEVRHLCHLDAIKFSPKKLQESRSVKFGHVFFTTCRIDFWRNTRQNDAHGPQGEYCLVSDYSSGSYRFCISRL